MGIIAKVPKHIVDKKMAYFKKSNDKKSVDTKEPRGGSKRKYK